MGNSNEKKVEYKKGKVEKNYFSKIDTIMSMKNCTNFSLINNLKICLNEKNFEQIPDASVQYFTLNPGEEPTNFINWLDFIYQYLYKEKALGLFWAEQMTIELDKEIFLSENKYLSEFFYEEFELENMPKCLYNETNLNNSTIKSQQKINLDNSNLNITRNLGGSFMNSPNNIEERNTINLKYKYFRDKIKGYINKFKQHIFNKDHPINRVTQIFVELWVKYAEIKINSLKKKYSDLNNKFNIDEINLVVNDLTQELQRFVVHLQISLKLFYSRTINYSYFNEEKDELINLITSLLFRTGNIYNTVFELYRLSMEQEIEKTTKNFQNLKKANPEEFGINKQYCLNLITLILQEEILNKKLKELDESNSIGNNSINNNEEEDNNKGNDFEKKKIGIILEVVKDNKKKCPRYGDREIEETLVNLNYEENDNLIINGVNIEEFNLKQENIEKNIDEELGVKKLSLLPIHELYGDQTNTIDNNNPNSFLLEQDEINTVENDKELLNNNSNNKAMIIRTSNTYQESVNKAIQMPKLKKIFNRISYTRTKNIEYLSYPYETAIQLLKQVKKFKTPFEKMMIFASISSEITDCINDFWKPLDCYIDNNLLNLEIDQLMTIFIYIIIQSQIYDIGVHCKIIKSFTTCITKASMIGYYYSTVEASVLYISSINDIKELIKNKITN